MHPRHHSCPIMKLLLQIHVLGAKNIGVAYQILVDVVFSKRIGCNPKVYIDDMIVKTS